MPLAPDSVAIKTLFSDAVSAGTRGKVANVLGVTPGDITHRYDPTHDRKMHVAEGMRELWALAVVDQEAYAIIRPYIVLLLDSWMEQAPTTDKNLSGLIGDVGAKLNELQKARFIECRGAHVQREEALSMIALLQEFLNGLEQQFELKATSSNVKEMRR